ncbi:NAD(P)/FAD-dependent oxidoreductase [Peptostreptococcus stomatis]|uniref:NAD(P)/FAD-dependent oxidoreductase n=1 Tax=Peptostreptococcus stomatis TaxID=341694 RepID=UPI0028DC872B|nr:NAD(P)/FAD-dependent oxidoreductase [Peptostreptococcus stomatis]
MKKVIVIGAGAAGMMAAYFAAREGAHVTIIEKNKILGRKIRITGKGRCNVTNASDLDTIINNIYRNGNFMYSSLYSFTNDDLIDLFESFGLKLKTERGNRVFPLSDKAIDVVKAMEKMLDSQAVNIKTGAKVRSILLDGNKVKGLILSNGTKIFADKIILATGGKSYPLTGSTGDGYTMAKECGHRVTNLYPSLIGMETVQDIKRDMVGLNLRNISIKLYKNSKEIYQDFGELEFREYGLDGPVIKSGSCYIDDFQKNNYRILLDLKPALSNEKLDARILRDFEKYSNNSFETGLKDLLHKKMIDYIIDKVGIDRKKPVHQVSKEERHRLLSLIKGIDFDIKRLRPIDEAIITEGGIEVKEVNPSTMESKLVEGLYFAGEILDVNAFTGGFNLQIAFSTGYLAGTSSAREK